MAAIFAGDCLGRAGGAAGINDDLHPAVSGAFDMQCVAGLHGAIEDVVDGRERKGIVPIPPVLRARACRRHVEIGGPNRPGGAGDGENEECSCQSHRALDETGCGIIQ